MKQHVTAIAFNEKELESYVSQLLHSGFETVSEVKKSEDGTFYQALVKAVKTDALPMPIKPTVVNESTPESA